MHVKSEGSKNHGMLQKNGSVVFCYFEKMSPQLLQQRRMD